MKISIRHKINKNLIHAVSRAAMRRAVWSGLDYLASMSKQQVPLDKGPLKASCAVDVADDGSSGTVSYDTPYAVRQHETTWYHHQRGRKAKYLEDPVHDSSIQHEMLAIMQKAAKEEF